MDHGSCCFYALERRQRAKKYITCLLAGDGTPLTDPGEMHWCAQAFYEELFSLDPANAEASQTLWEGLLQVSVGDRDWLETPLTLAKF
ncbi:hypothetical protein Y1Q_0012919 [Alligator mississippiensis]|uniref:Uncharacterized protein n=1 Tax=Alligator mississippiensis TaxID=8496 RepID=A0A151P1R6_ALLMI|nr:hypothetical protein Y1Q_0012919 [Alligator mississippiensis]